MVKISMIAAIGKNRELGEGNKLIWHISSDLKRFKELTVGHPVIMGRRTYESIDRLLPNRTNIIVTRDPNFTVEGAIVVNSIEDSIEKAKNIEETRLRASFAEVATKAEQGSGGRGEIFIIGGAQIYALGIKFADKLYLTKIDAEAPSADAFFPDYSEFKKVVRREEGEENGLKYEFVELAREA